MVWSRRLLASIAAAVVLGACGGGGTATPPESMPAPTPSAVATPTIAPTPVPTAGTSLAPIASQYAAVSALGDVALNQCHQDRTAADGDLAKGHAAATACLGAIDPVIAAMQATAWGPAQPQADAVMAGLAAVRGILVQIASAPDTTALRADYTAVTKAEGELLTAANQLRTVLGLPTSSP